MNGKKQGSQKEHDRIVIPVFLMGDCRQKPVPTEPVGKKHHQSGIDSMQQDVGEVIAERIEPPEKMVDGKGKIGKGQPGAEMGDGEDTEQGLAIQAFYQRVIGDVEWIIEIDETAPERPGIDQKTEKSC